LGVFHLRTEGSTKKACGQGSPVEYFRAPRLDRGRPVAVTLTLPRGR
jgi:hypothetical protein